MKLRFLRLALVPAAMVLALPAAAAPLSAQASRPAADSDAAFAAEKAAFLALPLATRKAAQDALVWLGLYNGVNDGDFGKRTRDAIMAFQLGRKAAGDGVLSPPQLQALLAAADQARASVGFRTIVDARSGARIGAPTRLIGAKNGPRLDFASSADTDLGALYARLGAEQPTRKIAYKAIRPNAFFVVSGQEGTRRFYSRFEKSEGATPPVRGFTFSYPAAAHNLDPVALAVANSFEAFPAAGGASSAEAASGDVAPPSAPAPPGPVATALVVAQGKALTALKPEACPKPVVGGKSARFERTDATTGLAILAGELGGRAEPPRIAALSSDLVVLSASAGRVAANPATLASEAPPVAVAPLEKSASGAPAFDRSGALVGLIAPIADEPRRVFGVALASPHALIGPQAVGAFLGEDGGAAPSSETLSAGVVAEREKGALLPVTCGN